MSSFYFLGDFSVWKSFSLKVLTEERPISTLGVGRKPASLHQRSLLDNPPWISPPIPITPILSCVMALPAFIVFDIILSPTHCVFPLCLLECKLSEGRTWHIPLTTGCGFQVPKEYLNEWNEDTGGRGREENPEKGKCRQEPWRASSMLYLLLPKHFPSVLYFLF